MRLPRELRRLQSQGRKVLLGFRLEKKWESRAHGLAGRPYRDYATYMEHQALKHDALRARSIEGHDRRFYTALRERLAADPSGFRGLRVLCLAARQGTEVRAFIDQGAFAVGIDLNPGRANRYVVVGDFHDLQFADETIDVVFTNSLDHAFDLGRILSEARRVLSVDGRLMCEVGVGVERGTEPGFYESLSWATVDDLLARISQGGFELERRSAFSIPWSGENLVLRKTRMPT